MKSRNYSVARALKKTRSGFRKLGLQIKGLLLNSSLVYFVLFFIASVLGIKWTQLYAFHMINICLQSSSIRGVLQSVTTNGANIIATLLGTIVIAYLYAMIGFVAFRDTFGGSGLKTDCDTLYHCLLSMISFSIMAGGGVDDVSNSRTVDDEYFWPNYLYTISFFILIIIIALNVILGIILDTFGQLREERNNTLKDTISKCFICQIEAERFQRESLGFKNHIKHEHNMWQYLFFLIHLSLKEETEYTAAENLVNKLTKEHSIDYFPLEKAISLMTSAEEKDDPDAL